MYGDFNYSGGPYDGATTKTRNICKSLVEKYNQIDIFNLEGWRKHPVRKFLELWRKARTVDIIVFIPGAKNGTLFALKYLAKIKKYRNVKLYYFVAGSLITEYLKVNAKYIDKVKQIDAVFCETRGLMQELKEFGITNTYLSPTFDLREQVDFKPKDDYVKGIYRFCFFGRVTKHKGVDIACQAINLLNQRKDIIISFDIYGKLDASFKEELDIYITESNGMIHYKGLIDNEKVIDTLASYDANVFATYFNGECLPATVIESLKASTPVIISDWKYNREIITDGIEGYVFGNTTEDLAGTILKNCLHHNPFKEMRWNCYLKSKRFEKDKCLAEFFEMIGEQK